MKSLGLISQILTIGLSVAIALMYIQPTFQEIGQVQTEIDEYKNQREKIERVNSELASHVATVASINPTELEKLKTYMPRFVDDIDVMRNLQFIIEESGMIFKTVEYNSSAALQSNGLDNDVLNPTKHEFQTVAEGTYSQVKDFFSLLEQNEYPLEAHEVEIKPLEGGFLSVDIVLITYADDLVPLDNI